MDLVKKQIKKLNLKLNRLILMIDILKKLNFSLSKNSSYSPYIINCISTIRFPHRFYVKNVNSDFSLFF